MINTITTAKLLSAWESNSFLKMLHQTLILFKSIILNRQAPFASTTWSILPCRPLIDRRTTPSNHPNTGHTPLPSFPQYHSIVVILQSQHLMLMDRCWSYTAVDNHCLLRTTCTKCSWKLPELYHANKYDDVMTVSPTPTPYVIN